MTLIADREPAPDSTRPETNRWLVLVLVCFAQFMVVLDATIVNVALPSIQKDLELTEADLQWVVNSYTLIFGGFLLLGGRAADLLGRKVLFLAGIAPNAGPQEPGAPPWLAPVLLAGAAGSAGCHRGRRGHRSGRAQGAGRGPPGPRPRTPGPQPARRGARRSSGTVPCDGA